MGMIIDLHLPDATVIPGITMGLDHPCIHLRREIAVPLRIPFLILDNRSLVQ